MMNFRNILMILMLAFFPIWISAQAHLGRSEKEIRSYYPDKTFKVAYNEAGEKYISTFMRFGIFYYYFSNESGLSNFCVQVVNEMPSLNAQVETYNKKYVIVSDTKWKAYLEGGGKLDIVLEYNDELEAYIFYYYVVG
jgi:hypothetical protein